MKGPVGLNIMIAMGVIGGIVILLLNGRSLRMMALMPELTV